MGADGRLHLMATNPDGTRRTVFTVCQDGRGFLNKSQTTTPVAGLRTDGQGRLELRDYHDQRCSCRHYVGKLRKELKSIA